MSAQDDTNDNAAKIEANPAPADLEKAQAEEFRQQLWVYMRSKDLTPYRWATMAGISEGTLRNFLNGRSKSISTSTLNSLASAVNTPTWMLLKSFSDSNDTVSLLHFEVEHVVNYGAFGLDDGYFQAYPASHIIANDPRYPTGASEGFAAFINDDSANKAFPRESIVFCIRLKDLERDINSGDRLICRQVHTDRYREVSWPWDDEDQEPQKIWDFETSLREFVVDPNTGDRSLNLLSSRFDESVAISTSEVTSSDPDAKAFSADPIEGATGPTGPSIFLIEGVVFSSLQIEPNFSVSSHQDKTAL